MEYKRVFTGSSETEGELRVFLGEAESLGSGVPRKLFTNDYYWTVMIAGRNGEKDAYPGSQAKDDTGGFFEERDGMVYLTEKAKSCIHA
jgi:hypothetical protein